jgi:hypothetical protein
MTIGKRDKKFLRGMGRSPAWQEEWRAGISPAAPVHVY